MIVEVSQPERLPRASASLMAMEQRFLASWVEWAQMTLASLMVEEQRISVSQVEWVQMALASLIGSAVLELFQHRPMPSSQTNFHQWVLMDDLVTSSPPRALLASSQRWPASLGGVPLAGSCCLGCGRGGSGNFLQGGIPHLSVIWDTHLGWCVHWPQEISQFGGQRCKRDNRF